MEKAPPLSTLPTELLLSLGTDRQVNQTPLVLGRDRFVLLAFPRSHFIDPTDRLRSARRAPGAMLEPAEAGRDTKS